MIFSRIIHCCWFGGEKTRLARACEASWRAFAPDWEIREWDEGKSLELSALPGHSFFRDALACGKWAMASDWLRMAVLWKEGGVYLDYDVELAGDLERLCEDGEWVASEWTAIGETWLNPGSGIALRKGSSVAWQMLEEYAREGFDPKRDMMPWINRKLKSKADSAGVRVLPPEVFSPIDMHGKLHRTEDTVGIHHYAMSWAGPKARLLKWLSWHGGRGIVDAGVKIKSFLGLRNRFCWFSARAVLAFILCWCGLTEAVQLFARKFFHTWVAGDWFLIFLASDSEEMFRFVSLNSEPLVLCMLIALLGVGAGIASLFLSRKRWLILFGLFVLYVMQGVVRWGTTWTPAYLAYDTIRGMRDYCTLVREGHWTNQDEVLARAAAENPAAKELVPLVLIIGESLTTSRMGVYGYGKNTTPELSRLSTNGLSVLPPRTVHSSYTAKALQELLVKDGVSYIRHMRQKGYHPVLVSAQRHWERYCGVEQMVFASCERKRYLSDEFPHQEYSDFQLERLVREELKNASRPLFLIVHLIGSHFPCKNFPDYWTREDGMDDYDMTVRVTDRVVTDIISLLPPNARMLFTSDHGESPNSGSWRNASDPDLWRVPMIVYPKGTESFL